jgi:hypothetical protein
MSKYTHSKTDINVSDEATFGKISAHHAHGGEKDISFALKQFIVRNSERHQGGHFHEWEMTISMEQARDLILLLGKGLSMHQDLPEGEIECMLDDSVTEFLNEPYKTEAA